MEKILTFYSYKGGTGRSMSLANVAWLLGSADFRVLVIDWDLEAPGLHRYFKPFLVDSDLFETPGLIDGLWEITTDAFTNRSRRERQSSDIDTVNIADFFEDYVCRLDWDFGGRGYIDFMGAGRQVGSYSERVNSLIGSSFDWKRFYEFGGGRLLDRANAWFKETYDFVLIDSRTGVSDTSEICTIQMPDALVACFTFNHQSIEGAAAILRSVRSQRISAGRSNIDFFPLAMRIDSAELVKLQQARDWARMVFSPFLPERDRDNPRRYWDVWRYSIGRFMLTRKFLRHSEIGRALAERNELCSAISKKMARRVTGRQELHAPQVLESERERILAGYSFAAHSADLETPQDAKRQETHNLPDASPCPAHVLRTSPLDLLARSTCLFRSLALIA
jgi:MinD-like ATPase involved in chromosome partitioning or flagellar assembly